MQVDLRVRRRQPGPLEQREQRTRAPRAPSARTRPRSGRVTAQAARIRSAPAMRRRPRRRQRCSRCPRCSSPSAAAATSTRPRLRAGIAGVPARSRSRRCRRRPLPALARGRLALGGLAALTAWTGAVARCGRRWAGPAFDDLERLVLYLAALARRGRAAATTRAGVEPALLAGIVADGAATGCRSGCCRRPRSASTRSPAAGDRLAQPLTYWNGQGALAALGLVLAAGLVGDATPPRGCAPPPRRRPVLGLDLYLTLSRGAIGARARRASRVLRRAAPDRRRRCARSLLVAAAARARRARRGGACSATSTHAQSSAAQGAAMLVVLVALAAAAAWLARAAGARSLPRAAPARRAARSPRCSPAPSSPPPTAARNGPRARTGAEPARLASQINRYAYWRVAARDVRRPPAARASAAAASASSGCSGATIARDRPRRALALPRDRRRARPGRPRSRWRAPIRRRASRRASAARPPPRRRARRLGASTPGSTGTGRCPRSRSSRCCSPRARARQKLTYARRVPSAARRRHPAARQSALPAAGPAAGDRRAGDRRTHTAELGGFNTRARARRLDGPAGQRRGDLLRALGVPALPAVRAPRGWTAATPARAPLRPPPRAADPARLLGRGARARAARRRSTRRESSARLVGLLGPAAELEQGDDHPRASASAWSLSVEAAFYVLLPFYALAMARLLRRVDRDARRDGAAPAGW